jgi:hypothetical protein
MVLHARVCGRVGRCPIKHEAPAFKNVRGFSRLYARQGEGGFSFLPDQDGRILIRKNYANYPATKDQPAHSHTDLIIIYQDPPETKLRAIYFDNEGHTIHYTVEPAANGNSVQFVSEAPPAQPRYRFTYLKTGDDRVGIRFEIAPPGKEFSTYVEATARRKPR